MQSQAVAAAAGAVATAAPAAALAGASPATLLQLMWLASPALPVGGFSYSEGLEAAVEAGLVGDEAQTLHWLAQQLELTQVRSDWPAMAGAHAAWRDGDVGAATAWNNWLLCTRESAELARQSQQMGRSLLDWLRNGPHAGDARLAQAAALAPAPAWPVVFALATALAGAGAREALLAFGWSWAENMAQAAMKAVPLGQAAAQRVLAALASAVASGVESALAAPPDQRQAFAPMLAILSARHETQYSRLFRS